MLAHVKGQGGNIISYPTTVRTIEASEFSWGIYPIIFYINLKQVTKFTTPEYNQLNYETFN